MESPPTPEKVTALLRVLSQAVATCGLSRREIARRAGMNKDTLHRVLAGSRAVTVAEALQIFEGTGLPSDAALLLALFTSEEVFKAWMEGGALHYLHHLLRSIPGAFSHQLGDRLGEIRPRWGVGSAALVARTITEHVNELAWRDLAFGEAGMLQVEPPADRSRQ